MENETVPPELTPKPKGRKLLYSFIVLLVIALLGLATYFFLQSKVKNEPNVVAQNETQASNANILLLNPVTGVYPDSQNEAKDIGFNTNLFDGLTNLRNGQIVKALAESWITVDANTWRFNLRKNVKFSNGTPFTAKDVKFSLEQAVKNKWPIDAPLNGIATVSILDDFTVEIKTKAPVPSLIVMLNTVPIISMDQYQSKAPTEHAIGTGPYKLDLFDSQTTSVTDPTSGKVEPVTSNQKIQLSVNDNYYGKKPAVKNITYIYLNSDDIAKLNQKEITEKFDVFDFSNVSTSTSAAAIKGDFNQVTAIRPTVRTLFLNVGASGTKYVDTKTNPLANKQVRQALNLALDPNRLIKEATISGRPATQLITQTVFGYNSTIKRPARNVAEAKKLLSAAGFENGFTFTLDFPGNRVPEAEAISRQLADIGVKVKLNPLARDPGLKKLFAKDFAVFYSAWTSDYFDATTTFNAALNTGSEQNYTNYSDKQMDDLVKQIGTAQEPSEKLKLLEKAMNLAMTDLPWLPLYEEVDNYVVRKNLQFNPSIYAVTGYDLTPK